MVMVVGSEVGGKGGGRRQGDLNEHQLILLRVRIDSQACTGSKAEFTVSHKRIIAQSHGSKSNAS